MTAEVETAKVRSSKTSSFKNRNSRSRRNKKSTPEEDQRETSTRKPRTRTARRIAPEQPSMQTDKYSSPQERRRSSKGSKQNLTVDTEAQVSTTPRTQASTPATPNGVRSEHDLRSPGQRKSPAAKMDPKSAPIPDFITQTDRYGNASTPRSALAVEKARVEHPDGAKPNLRVTKDGKLTGGDNDEIDACTETLMDSFRIMCCCLVPEDETQETASEKEEKEDATPDDRPRLLPAIHPDDHGKKCLVLDLDETLVHSSFRAVPGADFVIPVQIEDVVHFVYVMKRPGVDEFLIEMAKHYEVVVYTASLNKYADPLLDLLDPHKTIRSRLFRESCVYYEGNYVKDLSLLDRDLSQAIIVDNSPSSYIFHPENAIDCSSFIDDPADRELDQIAAFLKGVKDAEDVRGVCHEWRDWPNEQ